MSKPSWESAPSWAKYLAQDLNGDWFWYEERPIIEFDSDSCWSYGGQYKKAGNAGSGWESSLEKRP